MNRAALNLRFARCFGMGGLLVALAIAAGCKAKPAPAAAPAKPKVAAAQTNAVTGADTNEYVSVFDYDLLPPKGKDPFYPASARRSPVPVVTTTTTPVHVNPEFYLKAIIHTSKHSQALVNNSVLEVGEPAESMRVANGHVKVRCLEIGNDYVIIQVEGEQPKRIPMEQKKN